MKNLSLAHIKRIQKIAIEKYKENMAKEGRSKTPEYYANQLMLNYENAIIEDYDEKGNELVTGYYKNGIKPIPKMPKYL